MIFRKIILLAIVLATGFNICAQNRIFLKNQNPVDVKYLSVAEDHIIVLKNDDSVKTERRILIELIDSLQCDSMQFIAQAYQANSKYESLFKSTGLKAAKIENYKPDTIDFRGIGYTYRGVHIRKKELIEILKTEKTCLRNVKKARVNQVMYSVFIYPGGFLLGYSLVNAFVDRRFNLVTLCAGGALTLLSIPFDVAHNKNLKAAIIKFNEIEKAR